MQGEERDRLPQGRKCTDSYEQSLNFLSREEKVKTILDDIVDKMPDQFNMADITARIEERTPYIVVAFQV